VAHGAPAPDRESPIAAALRRAHGILPDQGPIGVFVHHNTLHAYQHLPFHEGVQTGAAMLGARPYLSLPEFRAAFHRGRVTTSDLDTVVRAALGAGADDRFAFGRSRADIVRTLMIEALDADDAAGLDFVLREGTSAVARDADRFGAALERVRRGPALPPVAIPAPRRHRDALVSLGAPDSDVVVNAEMVRLSAGFLDQGQARDAMPGRFRGFLAAVSALYASGARAPRGCELVVEDFAKIAREGTAPERVIAAALDRLKVGEGEREEYLLSVALSLRGWAGMFARLERQPADHPGGPPTSLADHLAVRMVFESRAVARVALDAHFPIAWADLRNRVPNKRAADPQQSAFLLWGLARAASADAAAIAQLSDDDLQRLRDACAAATPLMRRQLWLEAYERQYRRQVLDAVAARRARIGAPRARSARPSAQFVFCIDEREESIRRALEEQGSEYETFGVAGFFGVAIDYQGLYDLVPAAHCPVVVVPGHEVHESPVPSELRWAELRQKLRDRWNAFERRLARESHSLAGGAGLSFVLGPLAGAAAASRVIAPRRSLRLRDAIKARLAPRPRTQLSALREEFARTHSPGGKPVGFSLDESVERVTNVLRSIGLVKAFAPVVVVLGHGSTSLNNPHESAHDCGACGGRRGGANARLFAEIANRADVRAGVAQRGIEIPDDTIFVGGLHDTADDTTQLFDLGAIPATHDDRFEAVCVVLEKARRENARERARRFDDAPLGLTPAEALMHVEERASHLAQPRPEYGHCTNAIAVVGRRELTRGLHLDRRPFLISYDPTIDEGAGIIERILAAVGPVGAGISLEYYFSAVDNEVFGCGTKLPHNVTGLIGVMNGHQGDLRTGLPLQMVELHEPMRLLLIVEATPEDLLAVAGRQAEVKELVVNEWVQLVSLHPMTGEMQVFTRGGFERYEPAAVKLPVVGRSVEWHGKTREFVGPALVRAGLDAEIAPDA
jgi:uncharacterized protein YbcC (UPF0753/DUF2309 family)